jgi:uncharacterized membrane protein
MTSAKRTLFVLTLAVATVTFCVASAQAKKPSGGGGGGGGGGPAYDIIPFAPFGFTSTRSEIYDVNESGTAAIGNPILPGGEQRAAHLDIASGMYTTFADGIELNGINNHSQMVGTVGDDFNTAVFWDDLSADPVTLPPLDGDATSGASNINDAGIIVGWSRGSDASRTGVVWRVANGMVADGPLALPSLIIGDSRTGGVRINELQGGLTQVAGYSRVTSSYEAVVWTIEVDLDGGLLPPSLPKGLGTLNLGDPSSSYGVGINNDGDVVGDSNEQPFLVADTEAMDQLPLPRRATTGSATDINDADEIVGGVNTPPNGSLVGGGKNRAVLWEEGEPTYLEKLIGQKSGWKQLTHAHDIAENGVIAGYGHYDVPGRGFLMIPNAASAASTSAASITSVPEPSTLALLALSTITVLPLRRKNREYN